MKSFNKDQLHASNQVQNQVHKKKDGEDETNENTPTTTTTDTTKTDPPKTDPPKTETSTTPANTEADKKKEEEEKAKSEARAKAIEDFKEYFPEVQREVCSDDIDAEIRGKEDEVKDGNEIRVAGVDVEIPHKKINKYEKMNIGWDQSAYFFDYIDPLVAESFKKQVESAWEEVKKDFAGNNSYDIRKMLGKDVKEPATAEGKIAEQADDIANEFRNLNKSWNSDLWKESITIPQLRAFLAKEGVNWQPNVTTLDPARAFVDKYDFNGDGRLSLREFTIGNIRHNKNYEKECQHCFADIKKMLTIWFNYADCKRIGLINAEQLWDNLKNLKRGGDDVGYNIYDCKINGNAHFRTSAMNDFILKAQHSIEAKLSPKEFVTGILTGLWTRQVGDTSVDTDKEGLKSARWGNSGKIDTVCDNIKKLQKEKGTAKKA